MIRSIAARASLAGDIVEVGHGDEKVVAEGSHPVLNAALFVARVRVAEIGVEPVMDAEAAEQVRQVGLAADPAPHAGRVVENATLRDALHILEHVLEALADAFGGLPMEKLSETHVAEREDRDEVVHADELAFDEAVGLSEVDLGFARVPDQVQVLTARLRGLLCSDGVYEVAHRRVANVGIALLVQPIADARDGVSLLAVNPPVFLHPLPDQRLVFIELR